MSEMYQIKAILLDFVEKIEPDNRLIASQEAARLLNCSQETARKMQDRGELSLCYLPFSKRRRFIITEVYSIIIDRMMAKEFPRKKFKKGEIPF